MEPHITTQNQPGLPIDDAEHERLLQALEVIKANGYAALKPFKPLDDYSAGKAPTVPPEELKVLMVLDFEATGKDALVDLPIEIGFVCVEYDPNAGTIHRVLDRYSGLEDPGIPVPAESTKVHGLTDEDVRGHQFDDDRVNAAIDGADLLIAHNSAYDRVLGERRFPKMAEKPWACSMQEGPWEEMSMGTKKQEFLAFKIAGMHYGAHRAQADCEVLLHILSSPGLEGKTCFATVLSNAMEKSYTVWAESSPFSAKDVLKKEGNYRWSGDDPSKIKSTWYKDGLREDGLNEQLSFLFEKVYRRSVNVTVDSMDAHDRYSVRFTERGLRKLKGPESGLVDRAQIAQAPKVLGDTGAQQSAPSAAPQTPDEPQAPRRMGFQRR